MTELQQKVDDHCREAAQAYQHGYLATARGLLWHAMGIAECCGGSGWGPRLVWVRLLIDVVED